MGFGLEVDVQRLGAVMPEVMEAKNLIDLRRQIRGMETSDVCKWVVGMEG